MPAWLVPAKAGPRGDWAIVVHGINGTPQEGLRLVPDPASGRPELAADHLPRRSRRPQQPRRPSPPRADRVAGPGGRGALRDRPRRPPPGPRRLLDGRRGDRAVHGEIAASRPEPPRWSSTHRCWTGAGPWNSTRRRWACRRSSAIPLEWAIGARIDADWDSLDALQHPEDFQLPILLFHGAEDDVVPIDGSDEFAEELPSRVTYYRVPKAGHTQIVERRPPSVRRPGSPGSSQKPCKTSRFEQKQIEPDRRGRARMLLNEEPAATYSPRGLPPKYHRRRVA